MIYLISQLWVWLLLTLVGAAVAGWAFAQERAAPAERTRRRQRQDILDDLVRLTAEDGAPIDSVAMDREADANRSLLGIRDARIAELEQSLEQARSRANELLGEVAAFQRGAPGGEHEEDLRRLRGQVAELESERSRTIDVVTEPVGDPEAEAQVALQQWRLRYFEQRVRYLETNGHAGQPAELTEAPNWRAREAEARAAYLETALRERADAPAEAVTVAPAESPFAANADVDVLLRWRLLYLERRVAHLQALGVEAPAPQLAAAVADPDRWKWRARYLEARVRHLESRQPVVAQQAPSVMEALAEETPAPPKRRGTKPPVLGAPRNGAPDDFTLIEGVSLQQQSTLYSLGVFHFDQIAAWTPDHVAWVDNYLRLRGRIESEEWLEQADELAREGPASARRSTQNEPA